jgi:hypothetical protein
MGLLLYGTSERAVSIRRRRRHRERTGVHALPIPQAIRDASPIAAEHGIEIVDEDVCGVSDIHVSDIAFANRNEKHHLPYGEGTLRVGPLRDALARFERPATIVSESPDEESSQRIKDVLLGARDDLPPPQA